MTAEGAAMAEAGDFDGLLDRLTAAGLATHVFAASPAVAEVGSLDEEADLLDALGALVDGPLWRVGPFRYALCAGAEADAVLARLDAALPGSAALVGATVTAMAVPDSPAPSRGLALLTVAVEGALALPGTTRLVIDAPLAEAAARDVIARIDAAADAAAARLATAAGLPETTLAGIDAAVAATPEIARDIAAMRAAVDTASASVADTTIAPALARIEAALAAPRADSALSADIAAIRGALDEPRADPTLAEGLSRIEALLADRADRASDPAPADLAKALAAQAARTGRIEALAEAIVNRLDSQQAALEALVARASGTGDHDRIEAIAQVVAEIAARPQVNVDFHREREGMIRLSSAMQTILGRLDAAASRLIEGASAGHEAIAGLAGRLDGLAAALDAPDTAETVAVDALRSALDEGLARLEDALARRDGEARSLVGAAQRIGAACAELHGLHSRYLDAETATPARPAEHAATRKRTADPFSADIDADLARFDDDLDDDTAPSARHRGLA